MLHVAPRVPPSANWDAALASPAARHIVTQHYRTKREGNYCIFVLHDSAVCARRVKTHGIKRNDLRKSRTPNSFSVPFVKCRPIFDGKE